MNTGRRIDGRGNSGREGARRWAARLLLLGLCAAGAGPAPAGDDAAGATSAARYRGDRQAVFTLAFDDSTISQADFVIPHMNARGLRGTFYINPGLERYRARERNWTVTCPLWDQELANHTMHHRGARDMEEARAEIGGVSELIWKLYPAKSRLIPYKSGGATSWKLTDAEVRDLKRTYHYFSLGDLGIRSDESIEDGGYDPMPVKEELLAQMDRVVAAKGYATISHHGVGPIGLSEWLPTNGELFDAVLDKLASEEAVVWTGPAGEVQRYIKERDDLASRVLERGDGKLVLELSTPHLDGELFIEPLTLFTRVPQDWRLVVVRQGGAIIGCREVADRGGMACVMYDAAPNQGPVTLERVESAVAVPSPRPDIARIRAQVASPLLDGLTPSSLIDLEGDVRGYVYQGKARAVAALWYHGASATTRVTLHDYSAVGVQYFLQSDNRHIDITVARPAAVEFLDGSGRALALDMGAGDVALELSARPIYLVGRTSRQLENLILYGFLDEAPHY